jgi:uncharacterized protein YkwD
MADKFKNWYYMDYNWRGMGVQRGPFSIDQIHTFLNAGEISEKTLIRQGDQSQWCPLQDVPIFAVVAQKAKDKRTRAEFWSKYRVVILAIIMFACFVIYSKVQPPQQYNSIPDQHQSNPVNLAGYAIPQEALTREAIITLTNNTRALNGLPPLSENPLLNSIAESRASDMFEKQYFGHVSPTGEQASDIAQRVGYSYKIIAENIGSGSFLTNRKIIDNWMQSPGHRSNILSPDVADIGAAVLKGKMNGRETYIAVQIFGLQSPTISQNICVAPPKSLQDDIERRNAEIASLNDQLSRLKQDIDSENEVIETDRGNAYNDPQKIYNLNMKINANNEKINWYNRIRMDAQSKSSVLQSMANEYNRLLQVYNDCRASK